MILGVFLSLYLFEIDYLNKAAKLKTEAILNNHATWEANPKTGEPEFRWK